MTSGIIKATNNTIKAINFNSGVCVTPAPSTSLVQTTKDPAAKSKIQITLAVHQEIQLALTLSPPIAFTKCSSFVESFQYKYTNLNFNTTLNILTHESSLNFER